MIETNLFAATIGSRNFPRPIDQTREETLRSISDYLWVNGNSIGLCVKPQEQMTSSIF